MAEKHFLSVQDYEDHFVANADSKVLSFVQGGCEREETVKDNVDAFRRFKLRPRIMRCLSACDLRTSILGRPFAAPVAITPMGLTKLAHPDGETAVASAAEACDLLYTLSVHSSVTIEDVARATPTSHKWFQLYILKDKTLTTSLIRRAEDTGYTALVIAASVYQGLRYRTKKDPVVFDSTIRLANYEPVADENKNVSGNRYTLIEQNQSWESVDWIRTVTKLPIIIKGVQTGEDARLAIEHGVSAVWVSNQGGRQLDSVRPTIEVLPEVVAAVSGRCEVYLDGGVRTGNDILKALALGARAVFVGRPVIYGLFQGGQGVENVLKILLKELETVMMLSGCCKIEDISPSFISMPCLYEK